VKLSEKTIMNDDTIIICKEVVMASLNAIFQYSQGRTEKRAKILNKEEW
jgi:hypothetical protein